MRLRPAHARAARARRPPHARVVDRARHTALAAGTTAVAGPADSLVARGDALEGRLTDPRHQVGYDILRFGGRLDNQLSELYGNLTGTGGYINGGTDAAPTAGQLERAADLTREWNAVAADVRTFLERDVAAFNAAVGKLGLPPVTVPRKVLK